MKRSQIILFSVFLILSAGIYLIISGNSKEIEKTIKTEDTTKFVPVRTVKNEMREMKITSYGQISPNREIMIAFEVQGKLIQGSSLLKPGTKFRQGDVLFRLDNEESFYTLSARKTALANLLISALPDIEMDFPGEQKKWTAFLNDLNPAKVLPELPQMSSAKERMYLTSKGFLTEYYNVRSLESRMDKYIYIAPFSGTVVELFAEPGSIVSPGMQVAKIAKTGDFEVAVPIDLKDLDLYKANGEVMFTNAAGEAVGKGRILRVSDVVNQLTQSADVYYSIAPVNNTPLYHGAFVNVQIAKETIRETMPLPRIAVRNGKVNLLEGKQLKTREILVVGAKPDTVFVTGLNDGEVVLLEQVEGGNKKTTYKGINR